MFYNIECRRESGSISLTITCRCVFFHLNCKNAKLAVMLTTQEANFAYEIEQHELDGDARKQLSQAATDVKLTVVFKN